MTALDFIERWDNERLSSLFIENTTKNFLFEEKNAFQFFFGSIIPKKKYELTEDLIETYRKYTIVFPGDIILNGLNLNYDFVSQRTALVKNQGIITSAYIALRLRNRERLNEYYYCYLFKAMDAKKIFHGMGAGIRLTLSFKDLKNYILPVPPRPEQDQIVRFLDWKVSSINRLINIKREEINILKEQRQRKLSHIITHGLNPEVTMKKTNIRWISSIPNHWECVPLKRCAKVRSGITLGKKYPSGTHLIDVPYLRVANVQNGHVVLGSVTTLKVTPEEAQQFQLPEGCVLMTEGGDRDKLGRGCVWNGEIAKCIHQNHIFAVTVNDDVLYNKWLEFVSASDVGRIYFDLTAIRTTNLACTNASKVMALPVPLPPRYEQEIISTELQKIMSEFDRIHNSLKSQIELLHELKARIIADVVTGKIDVRGIEIPEYEFVEETKTVEADNKEIVEEGLEDE